MISSATSIVQTEDLYVTEERAATVSVAAL